MKKRNNILLCVLLIYGSMASAQVIIAESLDCGWNYIYDNAGNRKARVYSNMGCSPSVNKTDELDLTLYPNPNTDGNFLIEFSKELENAEVTVVDNAGKLIWQETHSGTTVPINISNNAAGVYHVTVRSGKQYKSKTAVKMQ